METIYKYELDANVTTLQLPLTAEVLTVQVQRSEPMLWIKLDTTQPTVERHFVIYGTGEVLPDTPLDYIATFQLGPYVFHVFEL